MKYDADRMSELVKRMKGSRTAMAFAAEIGVSPSTITRIINKQVTSSCKVTLLRDMYDNQELENGEKVSLNELYDANGTPKREISKKQSIRKLASFLNNTGYEVETLNTCILNTDIGTIHSDYQCIINNELTAFLLFYERKTYSRKNIEYQNFTLRILGLAQLNRDIKRVVIVSEYEKDYNSFCHIVKAIHSDLIVSVILINGEYTRVLRECCSDNYRKIFVDNNYTIDAEISSSYWDKYYNGKELGVNDDWLSAYKEDFESASGPILDLGCGFGNNIQSLFSMNVSASQIYAIDQSEEALNKVRDYYPDIVSQVSNQNLLAGLNFVDNYSDIVIADCVLDYFDNEDTKSILSEIKRVLKPGGVLLVRVTSINDTLNSTSHWEMLSHNVYRTKTGLIKQVFDQESINRTFSEFKSIDYCERKVNRHDGARYVWCIRLEK